MRRLAPLLLVLLLACANDPPPERVVYLPPQLAAAVEGVEVYPSQDAPTVLLDHLDQVGAAYLDLLSVSQVAGLKGRLPEPAARLVRPDGQVELVGEVYFDWPVIVHHRRLDPAKVWQALSQNGYHLASQEGPGLSLYLPTSDELVLARLVEQWRLWGQPVLSEQALRELSFVAPAQGLAEADVSLLMRSQWQALKNDRSANVVPLEEFVTLEIDGPRVVAPWGLVTAHPDPAFDRLAAELPRAPLVPGQARLSTITREKARLVAHQLFPNRFGRRSEVRLAW
ncbi:MAG: hypothetical protein KC910_04340 [Candidatus Eremiobacteraeota bacterium]|nr:hypothetical protein [Candidatus Eremiobacteraeota bacterium]